MQSHRALPLCRDVPGASPGAVRELFASLDADASGTVDAQELTSGLRAAGYGVTEVEVENLMRKARTAMQSAQCPALCFWWNAACAVVCSVQLAVWARQAIARLCSRQGLRCNSCCDLQQLAMSLNIQTGMRERDGSPGVCRRWT
jgi:hypothetical protein